MLVFGQKWLYSGKISCIPAKVVLFGNVVVFGQIGFIREKWL